MKLSSRYADALLYTASLHQNQERKVSGVPYIAHLLRVSGIALEYGATEDEAIAALLHDAIEDQGGDATRQEILRRFGPTVVAIVDGCSDADTTPKPPWRARKESHVEHLRQAEPSVRLVVAADKLDNLRSLVREYRRRGESLWEFFHGRRDGTLWYYQAMLEALASGGVTPLVEELQRTMQELQRLAASE